MAEEKNAKTGLNKLDKDSLNNVSGGYKIEKKLLRYGTKPCIDPGTKVSSHKNIEIYKYDVIGIDKNTNLKVVKTFKTRAAAKKWAKENLY